MCCIPPREIPLPRPLSVVSEYVLLSGGRDTVFVMFVEEVAVWLPLTEVLPFAPLPDPLRKDG